MRPVVLTLALAGAAGCAGAALPPPGDPAEADPPLDGADAAYVARRAAQRTRLSVLYLADREALDHARTAARVLEDDAARREAFFADLACRRRARAEEAAAVAAARRRAFEAVVEPEDQLLDRPEGLLFRTAAEQVFLPGTSLLRSGAAERLAAVAYALRLGPACDVRIQVLDDADGFHADGALLAWRRYVRIHDALAAAGVPHASFLAPLREAPRGTQVDLLVVERPVPLPPPSK